MSADLRDIYVENQSGPRKSVSVCYDCTFNTEFYKSFLMTSIVLENIFFRVGEPTISIFTIYDTY